VRVVHGRPQFTSSAGLHALTPFDYYKIYNFNPTEPYGPVSERIAIVGRSNIQPSDVGYFNFSGCWVTRAGSPQIIVNGPDPAISVAAKKTELFSTPTWAGAITHGGVLLVVSKSTASTDGVESPELYIIRQQSSGHNEAKVSRCEAKLYKHPSRRESPSLAAQAATQGYHLRCRCRRFWFCGCDNPHTENLATHPPSSMPLAPLPTLWPLAEQCSTRTGMTAHIGVPPTTQTVSLRPFLTSQKMFWNESCTSCSKPGIWAVAADPALFS